MTFKALVASTRGAVVDFSGIDGVRLGAAYEATCVVNQPCGAAVACCESEVIEPLNLAVLVTNIGARCCEHAFATDVACIVVEVTCGERGRALGCNTAFAVEGRIAAGVVGGIGIGRGVATDAG